MKNTVAVIGLGYVGLPLALLANKKGYKVIGIDLDKEKVSKINKRICPFRDDFISKQLLKSTLIATTDFKLISQNLIIIICVPTPVYKDRLPNYEPLKSACYEIAPHIKKGQLIILESTVNPGVSEELMIPILEKYSSLTCGKDFYIAHCPERINPGDLKWRIDNIPRVVGGYNKKSLERAFKFYRSIIDAPIRKMNSIKEVEAVKVVENSFRNINIAFVNELAMSFSKLGIDVVNVIDGAATKPFSFMPHYPGCGIGGHCIPVDPYYLIDYAQKNGFNHELLKLSCKVNENMPIYIVDELEEVFKKNNKQLKNFTITVLGLAYKANVDDYRESPSFKIIEELKNRGAKVVVYDPFVPELSTVSSFEESLKKSNGIIVATSHKVFISKITPKILKKNHIYVIIDGRNCLNKDVFINAGIKYIGVGR